MDTEVRRRLEELVQAIRDSEECRQFEEAKRRLNQEPAKRKKADEFRRRNFEFQNSEDSASAQAQVAMYHEREALRRDPLIDGYLNAELVMCRLLRQVSLGIMESVDMDLDSMEDILS
ncbi:MAG TPA: hypothetical protein DHV42_06775 [Lachnospiraceae bacterium]|nr:hypothetical protein [Lachnospiraceae bacterium]